MKNNIQKILIYMLLMLVSISSIEAKENVCKGSSTQPKYNPGQIYEPYSDISISPANVVANGSDTATISLVLRDCADNVVTNAELLDITQGDASSDIGEFDTSDSSNGHYSIKVSSTKAETVKYNLRLVAVDEKQQNIPVYISSKNETDVTFIPDTPTQFTVTADPSEVLADGKHFSTITVTAKDANNNPNKFLKVTLDDNGADAKISKVVNNKDGSYTFKVRSSVVEKDVKFNVKVQGKAIDEYATVSFIPVGLPSGVRCDGGNVEYIVSVHDNDYSPYDKQYGPATYERPVAADGQNEQLIDIAGTLTQKRIDIPCRTSYNAIIPAYKAAYYVPSEHTEDGVAKRVYLEYPQQYLHSGDNTIRAFIRTKTGTLKAKKLDINAGIGDGSETVLVDSVSGKRKHVYGALLANFPMSTNSDEGLGEVQVRIMVGIPDLNFGKADAAGIKDSHMFLYLPVRSSVTGKIWLNNNLGADYANLNSPSFNLAQQANSKNDYHAYGSLFQWGGKNDGHELTKWNGSNGHRMGQLVRTAKYFSWSQNQHDGHFIMTCSDWRGTENTSLWSNNDSNVCPVGYHVPTDADWRAEMGISSDCGTWNNSNYAYNSKLKLTVPGVRWGSAFTSFSGSDGYYWSKNASYCRTSRALKIAPYFMKSFPTHRGFGFSVRCIQN